MQFQETKLEGAYVILPSLFEDNRGFFSRWFCEDEFKDRGLSKSFVQCNHSGSEGHGTLRGMHFQYPPYTEIKLVKCVVGKIYDVIVDVRKDSATFLNWFGRELSANNKETLYIPKGFAHGFQVLSEYAEIIYMVSASYNKESEGGIRYNDPHINITWPLKAGKVSEKDLSIPFINPNVFQGISI